MNEEKDCTDDLMECVTECDTDDKECKDACVDEYQECVIPDQPKPELKVNQNEIKKIVKKYKKIKKYKKSNIFQIKNLDHE